MTLNLPEIIDKWNKEQPVYERLGEIVFNFIEEKITEYEILPEINYRTKEIVSLIKKIKKKQLEKKYSYDDLTDKLGIRIICKFQEELNVIDKFIKENFINNYIEYKNDKIEFDKLDYVSNHYDVKINLKNDFFKQYLEFENLIFEIQVRTVNQHTWSNTSHSLSYKQENNLPNYLKRKIYRLLSLYELADDEFSSVNLALKNDYNEFVYKLLRKLEGKFYKYAKIDFDRDFSINEITILLNFLEPSDKQILIDRIDDFISENERKIKFIYKENKNRLYDYLSLTQPEIFIIWYLIESKPYLITDKWDEYYDIEELDKIKILWGNQL